MTEIGLISFAVCVTALIVFFFKLCGDITRIRQLLEWQCENWWDEEDADDPEREPEQGEDAKGNVHVLDARSKRKIA